MVRCRNFQKTLVIEIIPSPSIKDKLIANFHRLFYIRYRPFESNLSAANPNLQFEGDKRMIDLNKHQGGFIYENKNQTNYRDCDHACNLHP